MSAVFRKQSRVQWGSTVEMPGVRSAMAKNIGNRTILVKNPRFWSFMITFAYFVFDQSIELLEWNRSFIYRGGYIKE